MGSDGHVTTTGGVYASLIRDGRLVAIALVSFCATLGSNVAAPALPAMADGLAVSDTRIGLVMTVFSFFAMILVPLTGVLADSYGRRTVLLPSILGYGLAGSAIAFVGTFEAVLVLRAVQGIAFAAIMPLTVTLLGDLYTGSSAAAAQGFRTGVNGIGSSLVPILSGALAAIAWNYPFLIYLLFIPILAIAYRYLPEPTRNGGTEHDGTFDMRGYAGRIRSEITQVNLGVLLFGESVRDFIRYGLITFVPLFAVRVLDASFVQAGMVLSARGIAYIVVSPLSGAIVARFSRKQVLIGALLLSGCTVLLMPFSPEVLWLGILLGIYTVGDSLFSPVIKDSVTSIATDERRGGIVSAMNTLKYAGQTIAPAFFGIVLAALGFDFIFYIAATVAVAYSIILFLAIDQI